MQTKADTNDNTHKCPIQFQTALPDAIQHRVKQSCISSTEVMQASPLRLVRATWTRGTAATLSLSARRSRAASQRPQAHRKSRATARWVRRGTSARCSSNAAPHVVRASTEVRSALTCQIAPLRAHHVCDKCMGFCRSAVLGRHNKEAARASVVCASFLCATVLDVFSGWWDRHIDLQRVRWHSQLR
eukprot:3284764-Pleurochrysis_carterae.AAC.3